MPLPIEIVGLGKPRVHILWEGDHQSDWQTRDLRLRCGCAHCIEESTGRKVLDPDSVPKEVTVTRMELIGTYGVRIAFSDGHDTGIFRFADLLAACPCPACKDK